MAKLYLLTLDDFSVVNLNRIFFSVSEAGFDQTTVHGCIGQINPKAGKQMSSRYPSKLRELGTKFQGGLCVLCELSFRVLEAHFNKDS